MARRILILDDDPTVASGLLILLNDGSRDIISVRDLASAELVLEHENLDFVLSDVKLTGDFAYEGLDFVNWVRARYPGTRILLMSGAGNPQLEREAISRGALGLLSKPFEFRELEQFLEQETPGESNGSIQLVPTLDDIFEKQELWNVFQPIFELGGAGEEPTPIGFETLARTHTRSMLANPEMLFKYADRISRTLELELHCTRRSFETWNEKGEGLLFTNLHPLSLSDPGFASRLLSILPARDFLQRVVFEITEQGPLDCERAAASVEELRKHGARFAFDDVGVAFSHLPCLDRINPDWMKISQVFGTSFESSSTKRVIVANVASLAAEAGAELILEGIETQETLEAAREVGIRYGQGFHLARPAPLD